EPSNASRTLLFNIEKNSFDEELLKILKVPGISSLPEVKDSAMVMGRTRGVDFLPDGIPIAGILGDQQAALAGQACFDVGDAKCTYGTGAFMLLNTGNKRLYSTHGLLTTVAWSLNNKLTYAFEGASFIAGAAVQFLRDQLNIIEAAPQTQKLADGHIGAPEIYFVPALAGLGAPHWNPEAKGAIFGLTRGVSKGQIVRATLEGIAFQVYELFSSMKRDFPQDTAALRVDGGASSNDLLMQIQADILSIDVDRPSNLETTAAGAAMFAGLGIGLYSDLNELKNARKSDKIFRADKNEKALSLRKEQLKGWKRAVDAVQLFAGGIGEVSQKSN
ncbi:MAG: glycerol kinase, partial [Oligoflexales bacterium]|nr:glycerol kinase [Oligoflexales bacterium]